MLDNIGSLTVAKALGQTPPPPPVYTPPTTGRAAIESGATFTAVAPPPPPIPPPAPTTYAAAGPFAPPIGPGEPWSVWSKRGIDVWAYYRSGQWLGTPIGGAVFPYAFNGGALTGDQAHDAAYVQAAAFGAGGSEFQQQAIANKEAAARAAIAAVYPNRVPPPFPPSSGLFDAVGGAISGAVEGVVGAVESAGRAVGDVGEALDDATGNILGDYVIKPVVATAAATVTGGASVLASESTGVGKDVLGVEPTAIGYAEGAAIGGAIYAAGAIADAGLSGVVESVTGAAGAVGIGADDILGVLQDVGVLPSDEPAKKPPQPTPATTTPAGLTPEQIAMLALGGVAVVLLLVAVS